jgi:Mg2+-importing ATPase
MIAFGLVSSVFDYLTFGALLIVFRATEAQFQTGWFIESLMTELFIVMVIRTHRPFFRSKPGRILAIATLLVAATTITLPYTALGKIFGLVPLPWYIMLTLIGITTLYLLASELVKRLIFAQLSRAQLPRQPAAARASDFLPKK